MFTKESLLESLITKLELATGTQYADLLEAITQPIEECGGCEEDDDGEECDCLDVQFDEATGEEYYIECDEETLNERRIVIRVNSRGQRFKKVKCPPGRVVKTINGRKVCQTPTGKARLTKRIATRHAVRTKKSKGAGYAKRTNFRRQKALKKRKQMGLRDNR